MLYDSRFVYDLMISTLPHQIVGYAIRLGLFDFLQAEPATATKIQQRFTLCDRGCTALLLCLSSLGLLVRKDDSSFGLTDHARTFLVSDSPTFVGALLLMSNTQFQQFKRVMTEDEPLRPERVACWEQGKAVPDAAESTERMHALTAAAGMGLAQLGCFTDHARLLDIAGGSGSVSIALARRYPELKLTVLDLPEVCQLTRAYVADAGLGSRIAVHPADMFASAWPTEHDAILFSNVLHDWAPERCRTLLRKAFAALARGGSVYLHEMLTDGKYQAPTTTALYSFMMLLTTRGQQYSRDELSELLVHAGFSEPLELPASGYFSAIRARKL